MPVDSEAAPRPSSSSPAGSFWRAWRSYLDTPEFQEMLHREFPDQASEWTDPVTRRRFLTLMGASLALAGLNGCSTQPAPARRSCPTFGSRNDGAGHSRCTSPRPCRWPAWPPACSSRATKAGRPRSRAIPLIRPASAPPICSSRPSILGLYDPDRSQAVTYRGQPRAGTRRCRLCAATLDKLKTRAARACAF